MYVKWLVCFSVYLDLYMMYDWVSLLLNWQAISSVVDMRSSAGLFDIERKLT
jgi:hypothetical protein